MIWRLGAVAGGEDEAERAEAGGDVRAVSLEKHAPRDGGGETSRFLSGAARAGNGRKTWAAPHPSAAATFSREGRRTNISPAGGALFDRFRFG